MKPHIAKYGASFQIGLSHWERVDFECVVAENEDPIEEEMKLKALAEAAHKRMNPQLYPTGKEALVNGFEEIPEIQKDPKQKQLSNFKEAITTCTSIKSLEMFKKLVDRENNPELTEAYDKKLQSLQK